MIERTDRLKALLSCLTIKHLQNDLIITEDILEEALPPEALPHIAEELNISKEEDLSYLLLNGSSTFPESLQNFAKNKKYFNLFPLEGLNVKSLLKYDKLIMDLKTLQ